MMSNRVERDPDQQNRSLNLCKRECVAFLHWSSWETQHVRPNLCCSKASVVVAHHHRPTGHHLIDDTRDAVRPFAVKQISHGVEDVQFRVKLVAPALQHQGRDYNRRNRTFECD
eukprot:132735-Chlamydomonas_euryale.AAC.8